MANQLSHERLTYHVQLKRFAERLPDGGLVLDIGHYLKQSYQTFFPKQQFATIDRNPTVGATHVVDVEAIRGNIHGVPFADGLLCNGVTEQCDNPYDLVRGCYHLLKPGGLALFGIMGPGYPLRRGEVDRVGRGVVRRGAPVAVRDRRERARVQEVGFVPGVGVGDG